MKRVAVGVLGSLVAVVATAGTWPVAPYALWFWLPVHLAGLSFLLSGVLLWRRRPANGTGRLMAVLGVTWYLGDLQLTGEPISYAIGFCLYHLHYAVMGHLVLALPDGRLRRRHERATVVLLYAAATLTQVIRFAVEYPPQPQGWGDPEAEYSIWAAVGSIALLVLSAMIVALVVRRWSRAGRPARREYAPVWITLVAMGIAVVANTVASLLHVPLTVEVLMTFGYAIGLIVMPMAIAAGLLRVRLARRRVADLVLRLDAGAQAGDLRGAIAEALDDPTLDVWFPLPDGSGYLTADGQTADEPPQTAATTPVLRRDRQLALLVHDPALREQQPLIEAVVAAARLALDNASLLETQRAHLREVESSRARILVAADAERHRIQRDLHDGVQHQLLAVSMMMQQPGSGRAAQHLREVIRQLRTLSEGIHPPLLAEQGLGAAVEELAERAPLPVVADVSPRRWPGHLERAAFFVVAEALANVYKHAGAGRADVRLHDDPHRILIEVHDDGTGGADPDRGTGIDGLRDRVAALGGTFRVDSPALGGTHVYAELPVQ